MNNTELTGGSGSPLLQTGFTLAELAISMVVISLFLGALLGPISRQVDQSRVNATQRQLEDIKDALLGHATINLQLPCPDVDGDGVEDRVLGPNPPNLTAGSCTSLIGGLPWATLNVAEADAWNTRFLYRVSDQFSVAATTSPMPTGYSGLSFATATSGSIVINQRNSNKSTSALASGPGANPPGVAALVLSFGKNAYGGNMAGGAARPGPPAVNADETSNTNANAGTAAATPLIVRSPKDSDSPCSDTAAGPPMCEYDDQMIWLSANTLFNRLVAAGRMP